MKLNIVLSADDFRGDHSADVRIAFEPKEGETVEQLVARIYEHRGDSSGTSVIEIRRCVEPLPLPSHVPPPSPQDDLPLF